MPGTFNAGRFRRKLLRWYGKHRRDLPWRRTRDAYCIWVSEVMLQQTRVTVVLERYAQFLRRFPTIKKLARARLADVLAAWSGLGYYRRARALHRAVRVVMTDYMGVVPRRAADLRGLPGIGRYTAAAIASIAFDEPVAVVDGNVERVFARLYGSPPSDPWGLAAELIDRNHPGDFNQAMMELGATVCLPRQPLCGECPVRDFCVARGKLRSGERQRRHKRQTNYGLRRLGDRIYLVQRSAQASLMPEMWELPELEHPAEQEPLLKLRHAITNTDYEVRVYAIATLPNHKRARWVPLRSVERLPLTGLTRKILRRL